MAVLHLDLHPRPGDQPGVVRKPEGTCAAAAGTEDKLSLPARVAPTAEKKPAVVVAVAVRAAHNARAARPNLTAIGEVEVEADAIRSRRIERVGVGGVDAAAGGLDVLELGVAGGQRVGEHGGRNRRRAERGKGNRDGSDLHENSFQVSGRPRKQI